MSNSNKPLGRKDEIVIQEIDGEVLIYDLRNDKAFCLNPTSAAIWKLCDGDKSVAEIADNVAKEFKATNSEDLVWLALDQLKKEKLLEGGIDAGYDHFDGMSRRQVIRKIGMGSAVAIPIIASLVAPTALLAAVSFCGPTNNLNCTAPETACPGAGNPQPAPGGSPYSNPATTFMSPTCVPVPMGSSCLCRGPWMCINTNQVQGMCG